MWAGIKWEGLGVIGPYLEVTGMALRVLLGALGRHWEAPGCYWEHWGEGVVKAAKGV